MKKTFFLVFLFSIVLINIVFADSAWNDKVRIFDENDIPYSSDNPIDSKLSESDVRLVDENRVAISGDNPLDAVLSSSSQVVGKVNITAANGDLSITGNNQAIVRLGDKDGQFLDLDDILGFVPVIEPLHAEIHEGNAYQVCGVDEALADDGTFSSYLSVSAGYEYHATFEAAAGGDGLVRVYEGPTTSGGTSITAINKHRGSLNASTATLFQNRAVTVNGVMLYQTYLPGGTKQAAQGGSGGERNEFILKGDTDYIFMIINRGGAAKIVSGCLTWYEES